MSKYIIREVSPEASDFSFYFDDDGLTENGGSYFYNLFIVSNDGWGFNMEEYKRIIEKADTIISDFEYVEDGVTDYDGKRYTFKKVMEENDIAYNSRRCHDLKEWARRADTGNTDDIAEFLTITTGKKWATSSASGYCQGDYVEMVYCPEFYRNGVQAYGEIYLGAGKEFSVTEYDDDENELDTVYGFIVADCQAWKDEDYKKLVCDWYGCSEEETTLEMIDSYSYHTTYSYRAVC